MSNNNLSKNNLFPYISYVLDDAMSIRKASELNKDNLNNVRLVGWQCGFEPLVVAVISMFDNTIVDEDDAREIAKDYLEEIEWFGESGPRDADFVR